MKLFSLYKSMLHSAKSILPTLRQKETFGTTLNHSVEAVASREGAFGT